MQSSSTFYRRMYLLEYQIVGPFDHSLRSMKEYIFEQTDGDYLNFFENNSGERYILRGKNLTVGRIKYHLPLSAVMTYRAVRCSLRNSRSNIFARLTSHTLTRTVSQSITQKAPTRRNLRLIGPTNSSM